MSKQRALRAKQLPSTKASSDDEDEEPKEKSQDDIKALVRSELKEARVTRALQVRNLQSFVAPVL